MWCRAMVWRFDHPVEADRKRNVQNQVVCGLSTSAITAVANGSEGWNFSPSRRSNVTAAVVTRTSRREAGRFSPDLDFTTAGTGAYPSAVLSRGSTRRAVERCLGDPGEPTSCPQEAVDRTSRSTNSDVTVNWSVLRRGSPHHSTFRFAPLRRRASPWCRRTSGSPRWLSLAGTRPLWRRPRRWHRRRQNPSRS